MTNLKPCPFCRCNNAKIRDRDSGYWAAVCGYCGAQGGMRSSKRAAADSWNMRATELNTQVPQGLQSESPG